MELRTGPGGNQGEIAQRLRESLIEVTTTEHQLRGEIERVEAQLAKLPPPPDTPAPEELPPASAPPAAGPADLTEPANQAAGPPEASASPTSSAAPAPAEETQSRPSVANATEGNVGTSAAPTEGASGPADTMPGAAPGADSQPVTPSEADESALVSGLPRPPTNAGPRAHLETRLAELQFQLGDVQAAKESIASQLRNLPATLATAEANANVLAVRQLLAAAGIDDPDRESLEPLTELSKLSVDEELAALRREMGLDPPAPSSGPQLGPPKPPDDRKPPAS